MEGVPFVTVNDPELIMGVAVINVILPALPGVAVEVGTPEDCKLPVWIPVPVVAPAIIVILPRDVFVLPPILIVPGA